MADTPQTLVDDFRANATFGISRPKVETLPNGDFILFYSEKEGNEDFKILGQRFDPDGNKIGDEINFVFDRKIEEEQFDVLVQSNGQVVIAAETNDAGQKFLGTVADDVNNPGAPDIEARVFNLEGPDAEAVDSFVITSTPGHATSYNPAIASTGFNSFSAFYSDARFGFDGLFQTTVLFGSAQVFEDKITNFTGRPDADLDADTLSNGNVVVLLDPDADKGFRSKFEFYIMTPGGSLVKKKDELGGGGRTNDTDVEALDGGGFVVSWAQLDRVRINKSKEDRDIFVQMFDNGGNAITGPMRVGSTGNRDDNKKPGVVALEDGGFIVFYDKNRGGDGVMGQRFTSDGEIFGDEFRLFEGNVGNIEATALEDGRVAVVFEVDGQVRTEILDLGTITGSDGSNNLIGTDDAETIAGLRGNDIIDGLRGDDFLFGNQGNDDLNGNFGDDELFGGNGNDILRGQSGDDLMKGQNGDDRMFGGSGDDDMFGGEGDDVLVGLDDNDTLDGGAGNDRLVGGEGADIFVFRNDGDRDVIVDFNVDQDGEFIDLSAVSAIRSFDDLTQNHAEDVAGDVVIDDGRGTQIVLENIALADLTADHFLF